MKCITGLAVLLLSTFLDSVLLAEKTDCPNRPQVEVDECPSGYNNTCYKDSDCPGKQKCCPDICDVHCTDPVNSTVVKKVCPAFEVAIECPYEDELEHDCKHDKDCPGNKICCLKYCEFMCVESVNKKSVVGAPIIEGSYLKKINKFTQGILKMTCVAKAKNKLQISWYKKWVPVNPDFVNVKSKNESSDGRKIVSQLQIANVKCEDSGLYRCVARTDRGYDDKHFKVTVYDRRIGYIC